MYAAGIDENGLAPLLGPMVVTGVVTSIPHPDCAFLARPSDGWPGLRDSKKIFTQRNPGKGEALALAVMHVLTGRAPASLKELLASLKPDAAPAFPCAGPGLPGFCLDSDLSLPVWAERAEVERTAEKLSHLLDRVGGFSGKVFSVFWCPLMLNDQWEAGVNKFTVDLRSFLLLAAHFRSILPGPLDVVAGKVGSRVFYEEELGRIGVLPMVLRRCREESCYRVGQELVLRFVVDADDKFVHVSMASIVGKYVREVFMEALYRFAVRRCGEGLRRPSGYHDRVSKEFIRRFEPVLAREGISRRCLVRDR